MSQVIYTFPFDQSVFRLASEAIRVHSQDSLVFESVSSTALKGMENFLCSAAPASLVAAGLAADRAGEVRITLRIPLHQKPLFQAARDLAARYSDHSTPTRLTFVIALLAVFHGTFKGCSYSASNGRD